MTFRHNRLYRIDGINNPLKNKNHEKDNILSQFITSGFISCFV